MSNKLIKKQRDLRQQRINECLLPKPKADDMTDIKLSVWRKVAQDYPDEPLRGSNAYAEWFAHEWDDGNDEILRLVLPILCKMTLENYELYQKMRFAHKYINDVVLTAARQEHTDKAITNTVY